MGLKLYTTRVETGNLSGNSAPHDFPYDSWNSTRLNNLGRCLKLAGCQQSTRTSQGAGRVENIAGRVWGGAELRRTRAARFQGALPEVMSTTGPRETHDPQLQGLSAGPNQIPPKNKNKDVEASSRTWHLHPEVAGLWHPSSLCRRCHPFPGCSASSDPSPGASSVRPSV